MRDAGGYVAGSQCGIAKPGLSLRCHMFVQQQPAYSLPILALPACELGAANWMSLPWNKGSGQRHRNLSLLIWAFSAPGYA